MADRTDTLRQALDAVSDFADAIVYMADGALSKGPDFEAAAYLEGIKALAEKTQAAIQPAADTLQDDAQASPSAHPSQEEATGTHVPPGADLPGHLAALGREATYEIAALAQAIVEHYGQLTGEDQRPLVVRGMALRIHELNGHVMSLLDVPEEFASGPNGRQMRQRIMGEAEGDRK